MIKIDRKKYKLNETNYVKEVFEKNRIIVGNSFSDDMSFINGWKKRCGGQYKKTSAFSIDKDGVIYQHYDPKYYSEFIYGDSINQTSIPITLINEGWLTQIGDEFYNLRNIKYTGDVINKYWRGYDFWSTYTDEQYSSLRELLLHLMKKFDIYEKVVSHNTKLNVPEKFNGMVTRSNFSKLHTDLSPTFNLNNLKKK